MLLFCANPSPPQNKSTFFGNLASKSLFRGRILYRIEELETTQSQFPKAILQADPQAAEAVFAASQEINRRCFGEIFCRAANFGYFVSCPENLGEHLIVEDEIVRVFLERELFKKLSGKSAVAGVIFGELGAC